MLQRRTAPGIFVGKCSSTGPEGPDRLSCSISRRGAERTNANEMQGIEPATTYCPVRSPRHAPPSAPTLNTTLSPPNRNHSKIGFACNSVLPISCHRHRKVTDRHRKVTHSSEIPETGCVAFGANCGESISQEIGNPVPAQNQQRNACVKHRGREWTRRSRDTSTIADLQRCVLESKARQRGVSYADRETGFC